MLRFGLLLAFFGADPCPRSRDFATGVRTGLEVFGQPDRGAEVASRQLQETLKRFRSNALVRDRAGRLRDKTKDTKIDVELADIQRQSWAPVGPG